MRKWWYAGATFAGGIFLFGAASPAQADLLPGTGTAVQQADQRLAYVLGDSNGARVENPLRYSTLGDSNLGGNPVVQFKSGKNSPDLNPMLPGESEPGERPGLPGSDVVGSLTQPGGQPNVGLQQLPLTDLVGDRGRLVTVPGLLPGGESPGVLGRVLPQAGGGDGLLPQGGGDSARGPDERPWAQQTESGEPLLGGLPGLLPVESLPRVLPAGIVPDTSGLPGGGFAVIPADSPDPAFAAPSVQKPKPAAVPDDPRLHEEPIDGEHRTFSSDARPIAGVDGQFN
jgi:hypothetical protein